MSERKPILPKGLIANPAFSPAVQVGELLFVPGQFSQDDRGNVVGAGDCAAQTRQVMARLKTIVEAAGATMQDVVQITTFLTDAANEPAFNQVRSQTFRHNPLISTTVIEAALARPEYLVEVAAVVHLPHAG